MTDTVSGGSSEISLTGLLVFDRADITIRPAAESDQTLRRALFHADRGADFARLNLDIATLTLLLDQQFHAQQAAYRQAFPGADDIVIALGGTAVGLLMTIARDATTLHIIDIIVAADARGRGIGTAVIESLGQAAQATGITRLTLSVLCGNTSACRLYERLGFHRIRDDGARIAMTKNLA